MNIIYIKLGVDVDNFKNTRLGLSMDLDMPLAAVNYDDMDSLMVDALNQEVIVQITSEEYYDLFNAIVPAPPTVVNTNYLITLSNYIIGCPDPGDAFFLLRAGVFYKVSWASLKSCIGSKPQEVWRVGAVGKPAEGDDTYTANILDSDVAILVNGVKIYPDTVYDVDDLPGIDYYVQDKIAKTITRPATFGTQETIDITQI